MKEPTQTEPEITAIPEVYSTMPNKWEKWKPRTKDEQKREVLQGVAVFFSYILPMGEDQKKAQNKPSGRF